VRKWAVVARARVDSADKLYVQAPRAAGWAALVSWPAVILAFAVTRSFGATGIYLPAAADAHFELWCIVVALPAAIVALDCWFGLGASMRALASDFFTAAVVGATMALAAISPLMVLWQVESRPAWLWVLAAQFLWPFAGLFTAHAVSGRRQRRLFPPPPKPARSRDAWLAELGITPDHADGADDRDTRGTPGRHPVPSRGDAHTALDRAVAARPSVHVAGSGHPADIGHHIRESAR
jgi:hypothetical protein